MEPSKRLYDLVAAMSKQEKRYFKLYASFYTKKSSRKSEQLFDCINKSGIGSDAALQQAYADAFPLRSLPRIKNELTALLLESLVSFRSQHLKESDIRSALAQVEVLLEKGLHRHAALILDRAKKKAREVESYPLLMQALFWERSLLLSRYDKDLEQQLERHYEEVEQTLQQQENYHRYARLQDFSVLLWGSHKQQAGDAAANTLQEYVKHPLMREESLAGSTRARVARLHILGMEALSRNDNKRATELYGEIIRLLENHPPLIKNNGNQYVRYLLQHLACLVEIKNEQDATAVAARIREFERLPLQQKRMLRLGALVLELTLYINLGEVSRARTLVEEIENFLGEAGEAIHPQTYISACHNCMVLHFLTGDNAKALEYTNRILDERRIVLRKDLQECARAFNLVLHYDLGHTDSLEHLFRSTYRYLKQSDRLDSYEKIVLNYIRTLLNCSDRSERQSVLRGLHTELENLHRKRKSPITGLEELLYWTAGKLEGRPIREIYQSGLQPES